MGEKRDWRRGKEGGREAVRERERKRERESDNFQLLVYSPRGHSSWCWTRPKAGTQSCFCISHIGAGAQGPVPTWDAAITNRGLTCYAPILMSLSFRNCEMYIVYHFNQFK